MARRRNFEKANRIAKVKKADFDRYQDEVFGKEPKDRRNPSAERKLTRNEQIMQKYFKIMRKQKEQAKQAAEENAKLEKEKRKQQNAIQRRLDGEKAVDLVFTAIHSERIDYEKVLSEDWRFNSERVAVYFCQKVGSPVPAVKCEYLCLGFPKKIVDQLQSEIRVHLQKTPHAILRVERLLIDRLSRISLRLSWKRISESTIRQVFQINKKALKKAQKRWPDTYQTT